MIADEFQSVFQQVSKSTGQFLIRSSHPLALSRAVEIYIFFASRSRLPRFLECSLKGQNDIASSTRITKAVSESKRQVTINSIQN